VEVSSVILSFNPWATIGTGAKAVPTRLPYRVSPAAETPGGGGSRRTAAVLARHFAAGVAPGGIGIALPARNVPPGARAAQKQPVCACSVALSVRILNGTVERTASDRAASV